MSVPVLILKVLGRELHIHSGRGAVLQLSRILLRIMYELFGACMTGTCGDTTSAIEFTQMGAMGAKELIGSNPRFL